MSTPTEGGEISTSRTAPVSARLVSAVDIRVDHTHPDIQIQIDELRESLERTAYEIQEIRSLIQRLPVRVRIVETREVTVDEAKEIISDYLQTHEVAYPDDIADELGLDLRVTMEAVTQLIREGRIREAEE